MGRPFSERVVGDDWRREAGAWIAEQLERHGLTRMGPIAQPRVRPWSTQLTIPTDAGVLWFKANCSGAAFEPRLHAELARLAPDSVDAPYAIAADRGWMLTRDRGVTLGESHEPMVEDWRQVVAEAAELQRVAARSADSILATGLPDCSPLTVIDRFDRLVELFAALPDEHPAHVDADLRTRLRGARPAIVAAVDELTESTLPTTWGHSDLHPWNVFAVGPGSLRTFDFGDSQWAHAAEMLSVPYGWITERTSLPWPEVLEAFCEAWAIEPADLESQWAATGLTQPVNRTLTWWVSLAEASAAEWATWGEGPLHHLTRVLDP